MCPDRLKSLSVRLYDAVVVNDECVSVSGCKQLLHEAVCVGKAYVLVVAAVSNVHVGKDLSVLSAYCHYLGAVVRSVLISKEFRISVAVSVGEHGKLLYGKVGAQMLYACLRYYGDAGASVVDSGILSLVEQFDASSLVVYAHCVAQRLNASFHCKCRKRRGNDQQGAEEERRQFLDHVWFPLSCAADMLPRSYAMIIYAESDIGVTL